MALMRLTGRPEAQGRTPSGNAWSSPGTVCLSLAKNLPHGHVQTLSPLWSSVNEKGAVNGLEVISRVFFICHFLNENHSQTPNRTESMLWHPFSYVDLLKISQWFSKAEESVWQRKWRAVQSRAVPLHSGGQGLRKVLTAPEHHPPFLPKA